MAKDFRTCHVSSDFPARRRQYGSLPGLLSDENYDADEYLRTIASRCTDDVMAEVDKERHDLLLLKDSTSQKLKQNVYKNYTRLLDISRAVSVLEMEVCRLGHHAQEQDALRQLLQKMTILPDVSRQEVYEEERIGQKNSIASVLETVEGSSSVMALAGRYLVHSGPLTEVDPESNEDLQDVYAFLLNDSFMITTPSVSKKKKGPIRYTYQTLLELDNMNIKDPDVMSVFCILLFPDNHIFRTTSPAAKKQWMHHIHATKWKYNLSLTLPKVPEEPACLRSPSQSVLLHGSQQGNKIETSREWLRNLLVSLDKFIAQREFEEAVKLVTKARNRLNDLVDFHVHRDVQAKIKTRISHLSNLLTKELQVSSDSLQGGPKAARKAISLLLELGKASQASTLFLRSHSCHIRHEMKLIKSEGAVGLYVPKLSRTFFQGLQTASKEFEQAFTTNRSIYSMFIVWCIKELKEHSETFCKIIFSQKSISDIAECMVAVQTASKALEESGLSLSFALMASLHPHLCKALIGVKEDILITCRGKASEELWEPVDFRSDQAQLSLLALEMDNIGVFDFNNLVFAGGIVDISKTTVTFCKLTFNYVNKILQFYVPELYEVLVDCFCDLSDCIVSTFRDALHTERFLSSHNFILRNVSFTIDTVLPSIGIKIEKTLEGIKMPEIADQITILRDSICMTSFPSMGPNQLM